MPKPNEDPNGAKPAGGGVAVVEEEIVKREQQRLDEALAIAEEHKIELGVVRSWMKEGLDRGEIAEKILALTKTNPLPQPGSHDLDAPAKDRKRYDIQRAMQLSQLIARGGTPDGVEGEFHKMLVKQLPQECRTHNGILIPLQRSTHAEREEAIQRDLETGIRRDLTMGTQIKGGGSELVRQTQGDIIEILRPQSAVIGGGVDFIPGLSGPITFPRALRDMTMEFVGEGKAPAKSSLKWGLVHMRPRSMRGYGEIPRELIMQSTIDMRARLETSLGIVGALAFDKSLLHGKGTEDEPQGLYEMPVFDDSDPDNVILGVQEKEFSAAVDWDDITNMTSRVADQNAAFGTLGWLDTFPHAGVLSATRKDPGSGIMLWDGTYDNGTLGGYRARGTNQLRKDMGDDQDEHGFVFGNWAAITAGTFGNAIEIVTDITTLGEYGIVRIFAYMYGDGIFRWPQAFIRAKGITVAS